MGRQILRLQHGLAPEDWKPMKTVGPGVREIRVHAAGEYRAFYVTSIGSVIYVLHAFQKKTQQTSQADILMGQRRLKQLRS